jgi:hypothetical protein
MDGDVIRQGDDVLVLCIFCGRYIPGGVYRAPEDVMFADLMEGQNDPQPHECAEKAEWESRPRSCCLCGGSGDPLFVGTPMGCRC